ncbi:hypothetical protein L901_18225 [Agrobacterium sp. D14]|nr:hypothetical protein L901_18225 [Agrobacterium sp. D14]
MQGLGFIIVQGMALTRHLPWSLTRMLILDVLLLEIWAKTTYIHYGIYKEERAMPHIARVFQSGNSQAVRLPKEFRFDVDRVDITQEGDALILRPHVERGEAWSSLKAAMARGVSDDFMEGGREQPKPQDRPELNTVFP